MTLQEVACAKVFTLGRAAEDRPFDAGAAGQEIARRAEIVAAIAAENADATDRDARFPEEAIAAARRQSLLGIMVPRDLGGEEARLAEVVDVCYRLGQACSATAMIFAMHQIMVACLVRHRRPGGWHDTLLRRLCAEQLLLASSTTEGRGGGNLRSSESAIEARGPRIALERRATVISYGAQANGIVTTARRSPEALASEQVLVAFLEDDYRLEPLVAWDTLGMRGTCSAGFTLHARGGGEQILPDPYEAIHVQTMVPVAHLAWAGVWAGIAAAAVERARLCMRRAARQANGQPPPGAAHLTRARARLATLRGLLQSSLRGFEEAASDPQVLASLEFQTMINLTKVEASELAVSAVLSVLRACGLSGYRNDSEFAVGRHLRDILSSPLMISNDRILANLASASMLGAVPASLD